MSIFEKKIMGIERMEIGAKYKGKGGNEKSHTRRNG